MGPMPATDDEIREKYLERAIRELNALTRELQACSLCPRGNLMPVLGSGHPQADVMLLKHAPTAERDRGGRRVLRPRRRRAHEVAAPPADRPARRVRHAVRQVPGQRPVARRPRLPRARGRGDRDRPAEDDRGHGRSTRSYALERPRTSRSPARSSRSPATSSSSRPSIDRLFVPNIDGALDEERPSASSGRPSGCSASGTRSCRPTSSRAPPSSSLVGELPEVDGDAGRYLAGVRRRGSRSGSPRSRRCRAATTRSRSRSSASARRCSPPCSPRQDVGAAANPVEALVRRRRPGCSSRWAFGVAGRGRRAAAARRRHRRASPCSPGRREPLATATRSTC